MLIKMRTLSSIGNNNSAGGCRAKMKYYCCTRRRRRFARARRSSRVSFFRKTGRFYNYVIYKIGGKKAGSEVKVIIMVL